MPLNIGNFLPSFGERASNGFNSRQQSSRKIIGGKGVIGGGKGKHGAGGLGLGKGGLKRHRYVRARSMSCSGSCEGSTLCPSKSVSLFGVK